MEGRYSCKVVLVFLGVLRVLGERFFMIGMWYSINSIYVFPCTGQPLALKSAPMKLTPP